MVAEDGSVWRSHRGRRQSSETLISLVGVAGAKRGKTPASQSHLFVVLIDSNCGRKFLKQSSSVKNAFAKFPFTFERQLTERQHLSLCQFS